MAIYKNGSYAFDINAITEGNYQSAFIFSTQDINTAKLIFYLRKDGIPLPLSAVTGKVILVPSSGKQRIRDVTIVDPLKGIAEYVLDKDEIKMYGKFNCQLILKYTNGQSLSAHKFGFEVSQSLADQNIIPLAEYYVDDFESLKALIIAMYDEETAMLDELKAKFSDLDRIETKEGAQEKADEAEVNAKAYTSEHAAKTDNPHKVTKAQIGLSNVDDVQQASKIEFKAHDDDTTRHITADERTAWNAKETTNGAQEKADKALADAKTYVSNFSWVVATLQNGWSHYNGGEDVVFGIDASKTVWVRGEAKGGVVGTTVFTLPENMRPPRSMGCIQIASGSAQVARIAYKSTGEVIVESVSSNTNYIKFDFAFKAL
ncbi:MULTISPECIES: BppU family phage baseplate upper protein [Bacillus]|nr:MULTISPECIES: BppU family phage baseplate upper protein [Bacillus]ASB71446.1 Phage-like element PBSX protein XkdV [Bacillus subtilis subsp. subtilis]KKB91964.1 phage-like protein [Bacillus sp. CMAA 1185]MEC0288683.1 BppU family phage baseplate upper protein [Bacillus subtilis]MEC0320132.1 BppU family phage baseplate upper protein [Bacillus subtilis]MEC0483195.1 BppU family phage baseplate upper protein [Bacillus subtilis]